MPLGRRYKSDPAKEIDIQAKGWLADKILPFAETAAEVVEPFDFLVEKAKEEDEKMQAGLPFRYKGANQFVAEQITPAEIALAAAGPVQKGAKWLAKNPGKVKETLEFANPLRSEAGAVGKDISDKGKLLLDYDLAGASPRDIGTNPRALGTNPRVKEPNKAWLRQDPTARNVEEASGIEFGPDYVDSVMKSGRKTAQAAGHKPTPGVNIFEYKGKVYANYYDDEGNLLASANTLGNKKGDKLENFAKITKKTGYENSPKELREKASQAAKELREELYNRGFVSEPEHSSPDALRAQKRFKESSKSATDISVKPPNWVKTKTGAYSAQVNPRFQRKITPSSQQSSPTQPQTLSGTSTKPPQSQSTLTQGGSNNPPPKNSHQTRNKQTQSQGPPNKPPSGGSGQYNKPIGPQPRRNATLMQNILGTPKSLKSMIDIPALRQAVVPSLTHPVDVGIPAIKAGLRTEFGPKSVYDDIVQEIGSRPNHPIYEKYGFQIPESEIRQQFPASWPEQFEDWLGIRGPIERSEDAYDATLKTARANLADPLIAEAQGKYSGSVPEQTFKGIANYVNDFTGYGTLGQAEKAADLLAAPFYSPRMLTSRFQMLNPWNYTFGNRWGDVGKSAARKDAAKFVAGTAAVGTGLDAASDDIDVTWDPRSSDFASAKVGNTTFDLLGGLRPPINLAARLATGTAVSARDDQGEFNVKPGDTISRFARSKLGPGLPTMAADVLFGEGRNFVGEPIDTELAGVPYGQWVADQVTPMYPVDTYEAFKESGPAVGGTAAGLGLLGAGSTSYDRTPKRKKRSFKPRG